MQGLQILYFFREKLSPREVKEESWSVLQGHDRKDWSLGLQTLWLVSCLLYYVVLSKKKQWEFFQKFDAEARVGGDTYISRLLVPLA